MSPLNTKPPVFRYSSIETAHKCLQKYKRQWIDQEQTENADSMDLQFGTALHGGLQAYLEGDDGMLAFRTYWNTLADKELVTSQFGHAHLAEMGEVFLARFERMHAKHFTQGHVEVPLRGTIGGHPFEGTADYIGLYKGIPTVLDFKTSNYPYPRERLQVNEQMPIYAHLAAQPQNEGLGAASGAFQGGFTTEQLTYMVFIKREQRIQVISTLATKRLLDACVRNVILVANDLSARNEYPKNPTACVMGKYKCAYFSQCHGDPNDS